MLLFAVKFDASPSAALCWDGPRRKGFAELGLSNRRAAFSPLTEGVCGLTTNLDPSTLFEALG